MSGKKVVYLILFAEIWDGNIAWVWEDHKLYCLGHLLESEEDAKSFTEDNINPVVAVIDLDKLF